MTTKIELSRSEDFSLVRRSTSLTESCNRNFVTHYFEVFLALRIRVLVAGSRNVTSEDFSLVHRSNFLTESGTRNCVTQDFEVFLALRIRVLVAGSQNVTSEDFSFVHRSNFVAESCTTIQRRYRPCVTTSRFSPSVDPRANQDLRE